MLDPLAQLTEPTRPLVSMLLSVPAWRARYLAYVRTIAAEQLNWETLGVRAKALAAMIDAEVKRDDKSLYGYRAFQNAVEPSAGKPSGRTPALKTWIEERRASLAASPALQGPWPTVAILQATTSTSGDPTALVVKARAGKEVPVARMVLWSHAGTFGDFAATPMFDDGKHDDGAAGDGVFGARIATDAKTKAVSYYVEALTADDAAAAYAPARADAQPAVHAFKSPK